MDVEIWSDIACPWCYIGERRFEAALEQFERYAGEVRVGGRAAGELGISAVPTFVVDRKLGASGAQPPEALLDLLRQGWAKQVPASEFAF